MGQLWIGEEKQREEEVSGFQSLLPPSSIAAEHNRCPCLLGYKEKMRGEREETKSGERKMKELCIHRVGGLVEMDLKMLLIL